ncbi:MAG TPA: methyltransferase domain-containing protein [Oculatellaceae cyanobacterium]|jgi:cyclopropane fatty-acyl-phospholipid synthase-like methyltransferase
MVPPLGFDNWEQVYQNQNIESMPWFNPDLDLDLQQALSQLNINSGTILDLGTGPGTQAIALAERGFQVTATDLSETAIHQAEQIAKPKNLNISWQQDDIINSKLNQTFDFDFDRGCFHVLPPEQRQDYVKIVHKLLNDQGYLFIKCFSHLQPGEQGPHKFTPEQINEIFSNHFQILSIKQTVYQGPLNLLPKALFCILQKSSSV